MKPAAPKRHGLCTGRNIRLQAGANWCLWGCWYRRNLWTVTPPLFWHDAIYSNRKPPLRNNVKFLNWFRYTGHKIVSKLSFGNEEMHMMRKIRTYILTLLCLMLSSVVLAAANVGMILPQPSSQVTLDFYSLNDFQGRVTEDEGAPGAARLAGIMRSLARQNVFGTVFLGGSNMVHGYAPSDKMNGSPAQV